jgi:iron(III) transport system permease protein
LFVVLTSLVVIPLFLPVVELARAPGGWAAWKEVDRIGTLAANTLGLALGAIIIAIPAGVAAAVVLERFQPPGANVLRAVVIIGLFIPLPVYAVAWQTVLGNWLPPLTLEPGQVAWRPWAQGLLPAAWVHGMAGLPWVIVIVSVALRFTDPTLEEEASLTGGPGAVLRLVIIPRLALAALAATGWVVVQTATEIPVTDAMMVRTFAEEVYTQLVGFPAGVSGAVAVTLPVWLAAVAIAAGILWLMIGQFGLPAADTGVPSALRVDGYLSNMAGLVVWLAVGVFAGLPLLALLWQAGGTTGWSGSEFITTVRTVLRLHGRVLASGVVAATVTGIMTAGLAWVACWASERDRGLSRFLFVLAIAAWLTPGPLVGLGLKEAINQLVTLEDRFLSAIGLTLTFAPMQSALYDQPSPLPGMWAAAIRFFPLAVVICWPAVRAVPRELTEAAALDGAGAWGEWRLITWPQTRSAFFRAAMAVGALSLGEVSAGMIVTPPHYRAYMLELFNQMHYGTEATVAALCLVQVAVTAAVVRVFAWVFHAPESR